MKAIHLRGALGAGLAVLMLATAACGGGEDESEVPMRTVTDATGTEVEVPVEPQRVVTLHYAATQPVLDLGMTLVGQGIFEDGILPEDIEAEVEAVPVVASGQSEPEFEQIAELDPDLILAPNIYEDDVLEQLQAITSVYTFTLRGGDRAGWPQRTEEVADALNLSDRVEELSEEFAARQAQIAEEYADVIEGTTVAVIGAYEENNFYAWGETNMTGTLLMPLGFTWSAQENAIVEGQDEPEATVSNEKIVTAVGDADLLLLDSNLRGETNAFMDSLQETPLYQELPAVQDGHVYASGKNTVAGYTDANYTLDMVEAALQDMR